MIVSRSTIDTFLGSLFLQQFVYISLCLLFIMKLNIGRASGGSQVLASVFSYCNICTSYPPILTPSRVCALSATIFVNRIEQIVNVFCHLTILPTAVAFINIKADENSEIAMSEINSCIISRISSPLPSLTILVDVSSITYVEKLFNIGRVTEETCRPTDRQTHRGNIFFCIFFITQLT